MTGWRSASSGIASKTSVTEIRHRAMRCFPGTGRTLRGSIRGAYCLTTENGRQATKALRLRYHIAMDHHRQYEIELRRKDVNFAANLSSVSRPIFLGCFVSC